MTNKLITAFAVAALIVLSACKASTRAQFEALGSKHRVTLYGATGTIIGQWESDGNVSNQEQSDGWYFRDIKTGKLVEITGTIVIEQE